jgi:hypoxanthine phosphoribosyltransferase
MKLGPVPAGAPPEVGGVLFEEERILSRVAEMGAAIGADHAGQELVLVTVLRGGLFFLADLCREIPLDVRLDFMAISSYGPAAHDDAGAVRVTKDLDEDIEGAHVLVVEDVIDTGLTLNYLLRALRSRKPASLEVAVLLDRDQRRIADLPIAYRGFHMPDEFAVGYGLDLDGRYRNLRYIGVLADHVLESRGVL